MLKPSDYFNYFRSLAIAHQELQHDPLSELGNDPEKKKSFARFSMEEMLLGIFAKMKFPCLLVDLYELQASGNNDVIDGNCNGAITILQKADPESASEMQTAFDTAARILEQLLQQMYADHNNEEAPCTSMMESIAFEKLKIVPVGPVGDKEFGYRCEFDFKLRNKLSITTPPATGVFVI